MTVILFEDTSFILFKKMRLTADAQVCAFQGSIAAGQVVEISDPSDDEVSAESSTKMI